MLSLLNEPREIIQAEFPILLHKFIKELTQTNTINKARFTDYIDERIEQSFRLEDMAKHFAYSKNQLLRLFKKEHQTSPYHYLLTKRNEQAIWLLQNTSLSIKEIAYRLQFTDAKHLASTMKKKVSFTPSEIRKRNS